MIVNKTKDPESGLDGTEVILTRQDVQATINNLTDTMDWLSMAADFVPHNGRVINTLQQLLNTRKMFDTLLKHGDLPDDLPGDGHGIGKQD